MKNLSPQEPSRPCYFSKKGIKLEDSFYWIRYKNELISICSIHNSENMGCIHGHTKLYSIEEVLQMELNGEFEIIKALELP